MPEPEPIYSFIKGKGWVIYNPNCKTADGDYYVVARKPEIGEKFSWVTSNEHPWAKDGIPNLQKFADYYRGGLPAEYRGTPEGPNIVFVTFVKI